MPNTFFQRPELISTGRGAAQKFNIFVAQFRHPIFLPNDDLFFEKRPVFFRKFHRECTSYTYKSIIIIILPQTGTNINSAIRIARDFVEAVQPPWYTLIQRGHQVVRKAGNTAVRRGWLVRLSVKCTFSVIVKSPHVILLVENLRFIY